MRREVGESAGPASTSRGIRLTAGNTNGFLAICQSGALSNVTGCSASDPAVCFQAGQRRLQRGRGQPRIPRCNELQPVAFKQRLAQWRNSEERLCRSCFWQ